jgi:hypothetical protein
MIISGLRHIQLSWTLILSTSLQIVLLDLVAIECALGAPQIYKIERDGKIEFSSTPPDVSATPAALPSIGRWRLDNPRIESKTCADRGGIDCLAGADVDGSVICRDSFKDSLQRFAFECTTAKLEIVRLSQIDSAGGFSVTVRNTRSVAAKKSALIFKPQRFEKGSKLQGPEEIEGFGVAEFIFYPSNSTAFKIHPRLSHLSISCENCG